MFDSLPNFINKETGDFTIMIPTLLESLLECLKMQEESLITLNKTEFEQTCLKLFAIEKQLKPLFEQYLINPSFQNNHMVESMKSYQQKIRMQRLKNDLLFEKLEAYFEFLKDQYILQPSQDFVYSRDFLKKRS